MEKIIVPSLGEPVGKLWKALQKEYTTSGTFSVASPLSSTPLPIYQWLIDHGETTDNWDKVNFVLMDEMLEGDTAPFTYVATDDPASYEGFARKKFLDPLQEKIGISIPVIKPDLRTIDSFNTPIDLLILALGVKGNFANVMPGTSLETSWYVEKLLPEFRQAHTQKGSQSFEGAQFREYGMSLGPQQVLNAKHVVIIISGEKKHTLTKELLSYTEFNPEFPLSIIYHQAVQKKVKLFITEDVGIQ